MAEPQSSEATAATGRTANDAAFGDRPSFWRRLPVILIGTVLLIGLLLPGLRYLVESFTHEATDDAFLDADFISVAPKVAGQVKRVAVESNQRVKAGDVLLEIDPRDLEVALEQKRAAAKSTEANVELLKASLDLLRTEIATAEATVKQSAAEAAASAATAEKAKADLRRAQELVANRTISAQEFDAATAAAATAEANLKAAQEKAASDQSKVSQAQAQFGAGVKAYERAEAQARQAHWDTQAAELSLSYARLVAPITGYVTKKAVEDGNYVQVGQDLMALVPETGIFVTANFKETQLQHIRPGQHARIAIDSVAEGPFPATVQSIMAGSGSRFSLLPPENAVGNYVKVVQRVPVKIVFDRPVQAGHVLGPGMSVVPSVHVTSYEVPGVAVALAALLLGSGVGALWWRAAARPRTAGAVTQG